LNNLKISNDNRIAIIIGIDKYESYEKIPTLNGAANDAIELRDRLIRNGGFEIPDKHYLVGPNATRKNILRAVSQVFRQDNKCDLVILYFSGHGITDESTKSGYLAPYDMDPDDPFISGIDMEDLKTVIFNSKNDANVVIILDCCYAGISTETTRNILEDPKTKHLYANRLQNIVNPDKFNPDNDSGRGKIILASSEPDAVSREKINCTHLDGDKPHSHGVFSYYLIEGLDGKAADPETGLITINSLRKYIENQMLAEQKQKPLYSIAAASNFDNIKIAVSHGKFESKIQNLITEVYDTLKRKDPVTIHVHLYDLLDAAKRVSELSDLDPTNEEISKFTEIINDELNKYKEPAIAWMTGNMSVAIQKFNEIRPSLYEYELFDIIDSLSFTNLVKMPNSYINALVYLFAEVEQKTRFSSPNDPKLKLLVLKFRAIFDQPTKQS
jgi:hypothetical protein